jgi:flagella basal body P-ring formation protein FlgA
MRCCLSYVLPGLLLALGLPISGQAQGAQKGAVRTAVTEALARHYPDRRGRLKVRVRRVRGEVDTAEALRVQFPRADGTPTGLAQADLQTRTPGGRWEEAGWATLRVVRYDSVLTVQSRVEGGQPIPEAALETAWVKTTDLSGEPLRAASVRSRMGGERLVAARYLRSGRVLRTRDVRRPHTVDAGSSVRVHYRRGRLTFELSCTAREPGVVDEVVRVHCADLDTMYRARITGENTARWVETLRSSAASSNRLLDHD